jgi:tRNA ligase
LDDNVFLPSIRSSTTDAGSEADSSLIRAFRALSKKGPKFVRSFVYDAPSDPAIAVRSRKMNEFKLFKYDVSSPFPTLVRGLFTRWAAAD